MVNAGAEPLQANVRLSGVAPTVARGTESVLTSASLDDENSLENPKKIAPQTRALDLNAPEFNHVFPPISLTVLRVGFKD